MQELSEMRGLTSTSQHGFSSQSQEFHNMPDIFDAIHAVVGQRGSVPRIGLRDAVDSYMRQRILDRRYPNIDARRRSGWGVFTSSGPYLILHGQPPVDFGAVIEQVQLNMNDRLGPPPASRSSIDAMPTVKITQAHLHSDSHCPVCQERFELGSKAREMPCNHIYHSDCIVPWLVRHNSCPVCRVELPPLPQGHGSSRNWVGRNANSSGGNGHVNHGRRNPLSFLWPFHSSSSSTNH